MFYVDENLCTGCGTCLDACNRDAISMNGGIATINEALCTSCGRCLDFCTAEAIISVETVFEPPEISVPAQSPQAQPFWAGTAPLSPAGADVAAPAAASPAPAGGTSGRFEIAEKVLSGLLSFASFVLDRRADRLPGRMVSSSPGLVSSGKSTRRFAGEGTDHPVSQRARGSGHGMGAGRRRSMKQGRKGQGRGGGRGRGDRCRRSR